MSKYINKENVIRIKDYSGQKSNLLTAKEFSHVHNNSSYWVFVCECGNEKTLRSNKVFVKFKPTKSCGCLKRYITNNPAFNLVFSSYLKGAKRRSLNFNLSVDEFKNITSKNCFYCGINPNKISKTTNHTYLYNGIDRKNNSIGYTIENSLPCCTLCNKSKRDLEYSYFMEWIERISKFRNNKTN